MQFSKEGSYLTPEGEFSGVITNAEQKTDHKERESIRLTIKVDAIHGSPQYDYFVRADYWQPQANQFLQDARCLIGSKADELVGPDGELVRDKLELLKGQRVQFLVVHERKPGHVEAYRRVVNLRPEPKPSTGIRFKLAA